MNLSDASSDDSSSDEEPTPGKRPRANTYGASSTTSHGSALQELDNEPDTPNSSRRFSEHSYEGKARFSCRSSLSEDCSSPNEQNDGYSTPGFDETDRDDLNRPSFQNLTNDYTKNFNRTDIYKGEYSDVSKKIMSGMGHKPGQGLGKFEHGRIEPVEVSTQKGRRGLGLKPSAVGDTPQDFQWTPDESEPETREEVMWMSSASDGPLSADLLYKWLTQGPQKLSIDETYFAESRILKGVLDAKTIFDSLDDLDLRNARFRSNPYETIGSVIFINRAAVKMANIDAICDFIFTSPKSKTGEDVIKNDQLLYFADVCAGPGGFTEYVLYRKGWKAKGFGFTLKESNDFKLSDFYAGSPETFSPYYGIKNDGNIYDPANLTSLKDHVLKQTDGSGVHFLMADGGFSVVGQENIQEILSKQLYLCQCLAALMLVRTEGHFAVKLFDVFTLFSVGLIYIMYKCFDKVAIHKPVTSRPANSERYLICLYKRSGTKAVEDHLYHVNTLLWNKVDKTRDVLELVPLSVIQQDTAFFEYIYKSNCIIGEKQIKNLLKMAAFSKDKDLKETTKQLEIKNECLHLWNLKDQVKTVSKKRKSPEEMLQTILATLSKPPPESLDANFKKSVLGRPPSYLEAEEDLKKFKYIYDWYFTFLSSPKNSSDLKIFLGCGSKQVFQYESNGWKSVSELHLTLPAKTLLYGEIVKECCGEGNTQIFNKCLHVIDALMLGGVDISGEALTDRIKQCDLFCTALNKPFNNDELPIRCKRIYSFDQFPNILQDLKCRIAKRIGKAVTIDIPDRINNKNTFCVIESVLFMKEIKEPWSAQISKTSLHKYYYSIDKNNKPQSVYELPPEAKLDMMNTYMNRVVWSWDPSAVAVLNGENRRGVTRAQVEEYIRLKSHR